MRTQTGPEREEYTNERIIYRVKLIKVGFLEICESFQRRGRRGRIHGETPGSKKRLWKNAQSLKVLDITICIITKLLEYKQMKYI